MSITEKTYVERITVAFNDDGTFRGASADEHRVTLREGVEFARESLLVPLEAADLTKVIGDLPQAVMLAQMAADAETIAGLERDLELAGEARQVAIGERDTAQHELATLMASVNDPTSA